jgi:hypothetical protein
MKTVRIAGCLALVVAIGAVLLLALWQAGVVLFDVKPILLPSPWRVAQTLVDDAGLLFGSLWQTLKITLLNASGRRVGKIGPLTTASARSLRSVSTGWPSSCPLVREISPRSRSTESWQ